MFSPALELEINSEWVGEEKEGEEKECSGKERKFCDDPC